MSQTGSLRGILPAVVTPFDADEQFAPEPFEALLESVYAAGVDGVYVCGGTGEGLLQTVAQRKRVAEAAVNNSPKGKLVIVHVGSHRTGDAVELAQHAGKLGASAVSALPPLGNYSFPEVRTDYEAGASAAEVPLLVYFFPGSYPGVQTLDQVLELCRIPNVAGLKYTDFDLYRLRSIKQSGAVVFNGYDEVLAPGLLMGADGGIGTFYNVIPELFVDLYQRARGGDWEGARAVQDGINTIIR
ncbi:MAG: dihydrodipicolinate synthase family protein, partial [Candidatus Solibacter sp.]|nr:dihydrodipicolinate synthase family protein [Candidatus Solibacter sp.]